MNPIFKNRLNTVHHINGKDVWESRSVAVVAVILAIKHNTVYVLAEKRADTMPDSPGKWACPSGYMDWDENAWDCLRRELYEETGFLIDDYETYLIDDNRKEPFYVMTEPRECRQNIALNYYLIFTFPWHSIHSLPGKINDNKEVAEIKWIPVRDISQYDWAFEHDTRIKMALQRRKVFSCNFTPPS